jgi:[protein-PII] uridylyltransferase
MVSAIDELKRSRDDLFSGFSTGAVSTALQEGYTELVDHYFRSCFVDGAPGSPCSFVAVGGYGRRDLSLHSDVDIIILFKSRIPGNAKTLVEKIFYPMWDIGLDLGHGIRTIRDCIGLAGQKFEVLTSLLDSRFVCGDPGLYFSLMESIQRKVLSKKPERFSRWLEEMNRVRMATFGDASYLLEPNLKEGIGGLRDYHHILWLSKVFFELSVPRDLEYTGILSHREYGQLRRDVEFIGLVRNHLHRLSGRKNDRLTFDFQERIATVLHFQAKDDLLAVEQFLARLHAAMASIKSLYRSFVLTHSPSRRRSRANTRTRKLSAFIDAHQGEIRFTSATSIMPNPHLLMEPFEWTASLNYPLSLETKRLIREFLYLVDDEFRGSERIRSGFLSILRAAYAFEALDQMDEVGFLGALVPEFEHVRGRVQFDSYHIYPVGAHLLQTLKNLKGLRLEKNILLLDILSDLPDTEPLLLASLLHDIGKVGRSHARRGAMIAHGILDRMGYGRKPADDVLFLISNHLLLAEVATRRDLNDEKVVVQCARTVGTIERLKMLYLLTWADSKATGPRAWNEWTENLVTELFFKVLHTMEKGELATADASRRIKAALQHVRRAMAGQVESGELDSIFDAMSPRYPLETEPRDMVRHVCMYQSIRRDLLRHPSTTFALETRKEPSGTIWEILFVAKDRPGLFADMAGVLALNNINILSAHIYTWLDGTAVDIFRVSSPLDPLHTDQLWDKVRGDLSNTFSGKLDLSARLLEKANGLCTLPRMSPRPPEVRIDNVSSDFFTVMEVFADDRVGLLHEITHTLFRLGLNISVAKIATRGDQIADIFYVRDLEGQKVEDFAQVEEIRKALTERLKEIDSEQQYGAGNRPYVAGRKE